MWGRASQRDKERTIRILSELRSAQTNDYATAGRELINAFKAAHVTFMNELARIDNKLDSVEQLANTILNDGSNLDPALSSGERRRAVDFARVELDKILSRLETNRLRAHRQATCTHQWRATQVDEDPDGHTRIGAGVCTLCDLPLPIPSNDHIKLEKEMNDEPTEQAVPSEDSGQRA